MDGSRSVGAVTGAILAGGRATRFSGINKATLDVDGRRIIDRQLEVLRLTTTDQLVITGEPAMVDGLSVTAAPDLVEGRGPLGGLFTALTLARTRRVLVLACDLPFVTVAFARYLIERSPRADAVVPRTEFGLHPLCAVYSTTLLTDIGVRLAEGRLAMHDLLHSIDTDIVEPTDVAEFDPDGRLLMNFNTPADYDALRVPRHR